MSQLEAWKRELERTLKPKSVSTYVSDVRALADTVGQDRLDDLTYGEIRRWFSAQGGSAKTGAARHTALRRYYDFLVRHDRRQGNPMDRIPRPRFDRGTPRPIPDAHHRIEQLSPPYRWVAQLIYETGMTISEAFAVDVHNQKIGDEITVNGRTVWLRPEARAALEKLGGRIDGVAPRTVQRQFRAAGINARRLRHTFADDLAERGSDPETLAVALGHRSLTSARAYVRGKPDPQSRAREAVLGRSRAG